MTRPFRSALLAGVVALLAATFALTPAHAASPAPDLVAFFSHADMDDMRLAPGGRRIAALAPVRGRVALVVMDVDRREPRVAARLDDADIGWFAWVNDNRLVLSIMDRKVGLGEQRGGGLFAVDHDGGDVRELSPTVRSLERRGQLVYRYTSYLARVGGGSDAIYALSNDRSEKFPDAYRVDTRTGRRELLTFERPGDPVQWVLDRKGEARGVVTVEKATITRSWWRPAGEKAWKMIGEYRLADTAAGNVLPVAFDGDGSLIVASNVGRDTYALHRFDEARNAPGELLAAHPQVDLDDDLVWDERKQRIVGVRYDAMKPGHAWFDDEWAQLASLVDRSLPGRFNEITRQGSKALIRSGSDREPPSWYLLDLDARKLEFLAEQRKAIRGDAMPAREPLRYKARDGLEIPAFLTLPKGREAKNLPLVLYVHGGPWVRGASWTWRDEPAWLAAQGYAVLEPEFRGSTGWGRTLFQRGWKQWGLAMQDDLIDGIDHLAARGIVDPARVCIMGASYGGFAVMSGLARDPDRFRCGINYVGVTDINLMFDVTWSDTFDSDFMRYGAKELLGDPERDAQQFRQTSPLANAGRIKAPVLMAYGAQDRRVPLIHGERMRDTLVKQGTPVEWVSYADEGHGFLREDNRYDFYGRVRAFLAAHLGKP